MAKKVAPLAWLRFQTASPSLDDVSKILKLRKLSRSVALTSIPIRAPNRIPFPLEKKISARTSGAQKLSVYT